jgi:PKD repeat protein
MKNTWNKAAWAVVAGPLLFTACKKNDKGELSGPMPQASYTMSAPKTVGLTSQVTFTSTSTDACLYQWDFGDGTIGSGQTVTHTYQAGGTLKTQLIVSGRGGSSTTAQNVVLPAVTDVVKRLLTGGGSKTWKLQSDTVKTITVGTESNSSQYYEGGAANSLPGCQADDEYTFSNSNVFTYDAKKETFVAEAAATTTTPVVPAHCDTPRSGTSDFTFGPATGTGYAMLEFKKPGTFIAVTDAPDLTYRIISITANRLVLRAGKPSGTVFDIKLSAK